MDTEQQICTMLDEIADGARANAAVRNRLRSADQSHRVNWRSEINRPLNECFAIAERMGNVAREQHLRGVTINGETQYTLDPALLERFGMPDDPDAAIMAEMAGYPDYPYAHDIDGRRIPLLSARFPRPQRPHRPEPKAPLPPWHRDARTPVEPAPSPKPISTTRGPYSPASALGDYIKQNSPQPATNPEPAPPTPKPKVDAPWAEEIRRRAAEGPKNPLPVDSLGRPIPAAHLMNVQGANDPKENISR
jgi:hypothetical protein